MKTSTPHSNNQHTKVETAVDATKNKNQHIKVEKGSAYSLTTKNGDIPTTDFPLIARKVDNDLEILLEKDKRITFEDYFKECSPDLECQVTLPDEDNTESIANDYSDEFSKSFSDGYFAAPPQLSLVYWVQLEEGEDIFLLKVVIRPRQLLIRLVIK